MMLSKRYMYESTVELGYMASKVWIKIDDLMTLRSVRAQFLSVVKIQYYTNVDKPAIYSEYPVYPIIVTHNIGAESILP